MTTDFESFKNLFNNAKDGARLLLHSCCAVCCSSVLEKLMQKFDITVLYFNPNIMGKDEYKKRLLENKKIIKIANKGMFGVRPKFKIKFISKKWGNSGFIKTISGFENEPEGGDRCSKCFYLRLSKTKDIAVVKKFDYFATTLTLSPHKNASIINQIGIGLETKECKYLVSDFKKENGFLRSIQLSKKFEIYIQNYCGCKLKKNV